VIAVLLLAALALACGAFREVLAMRTTGKASSGAAAASGAGEDRRPGALAGLAVRLGIPSRIARAGLAERVPPGAVMAAKLAGAGWGLVLGSAIAPATGRLAPVVAIGLPAAGFVGPDALMERAARRRRGKALAALPDALDLLAVGVASGRSPNRVLADIADAAGGPLAAELGVVVAEIECGASQAQAVEALRSRIGGAELGSLAAALERSRRFGSPLAEQLHELASGLRREGRRRIEERASRAAPKIQLVIALVLVPSVLLLMVAALVAHSGSLLGPG
jgi:tight adherence protein C